MENEYEDNESKVEMKRRAMLAKIAEFCIERNFKFDVISPKKWITLTFESRNPKQDQGIDVFIDVRQTDDIYFVIPAAYDVLVDDEIPAVLKAVNINNNYVNPARCSFSEHSKKVIVDYTYPLLDNSITLEQFTRILMFVLESAEALRDNISKAAKKLQDSAQESVDEDVIPETMLKHRKQTDTQMYLSKLGSVVPEEENETKKKDIVNKFDQADVADELENTSDRDSEHNEKEEEASEENIGEAIMGLMEEVIKNIRQHSEDDEDNDNEEDETDEEDELDDDEIDDFFDDDDKADF